MGRGTSSPHPTQRPHHQQETTPQPAAPTAVCPASSGVSPLRSDPPGAAPVSRHWRMRPRWQEVTEAQVMVLLLVLSTQFWEAMSQIK